MDNALSTYWYSLSKDSAGKTWWKSKSSHPATYNALQISADDLGAVYACAPFRIRQTEAGPRILAAYPAPRLFDQPDYHWLGIEAVIVWDPDKDHATVLDDDRPQIVGDVSDDANRLFSSPRAFFQAWAMRRAQFAVKRQEIRKRAWHIAPTERDEIPGGLVIGAAADIHWQPSLLPEHIECVGISPQVVNRAIMKAARLPRATGAVS